MADKEKLKTAKESVDSYVASLSQVEKECNNCIYLDTEKYSGVRGQVIDAFYKGTCRCNRINLIWPWMKPFIDRPIACILQDCKELKK